MQKNILVTGGAGFIGSHLCGHLLNEGNHVICLDNLFTGTYDNIKNYISNDNFEFINANIISQVQMDIDQIYNLACPASPIHYQSDPIMTIKTNIIGALNMLDLAQNNGARILQASTSEIYGNPISHPQVESYYGNVNPVGPRACYDEGKRVAETLFYNYYKKFNLDIKIIRIFNTYGPRMLENDGRVISNFIIQALSNNDLTIYGDGMQTRSFCYITDMIDAMIKVMNSNDFHDPINIGNPNEITINKLAELVICLTDSSSDIVYHKLPQDDPCRRKPDISLAKKIIKWKPKVNLEDGLNNTISYFRKRCNQFS